MGLVDLIIRRKAPVVPPDSALVAELADAHAEIARLKQEHTAEIARLKQELAAENAKNRAADQKTIAGLLGCSERTVKSRWREVREAVRAALDDHAPE